MTGVDIGGAVVDDGVFHWRCNPGGEMNRKCFILLLANAMTVSVFAQEMALQGIEPNDLNRTVQPCDNFYDFSNGTWRTKNPIPASMDRWSRRWLAGEQNKDQLRKILDELATKPGLTAASPAQLTGDFYAACINVKAVDAAGGAP